MRVILLAVSLGISACAHTQAEVETSETKDAMSDSETVGKALARRGRFLEASFYFEAAIARGADEKEVLPLLIASQIQSDRLRAAEQNALRLRELTGKSCALEELLVLLARYTPEIDNTSEEVAP